MKRVICLYRVSTVGQVDHDDIPMQKLACREYAKTHPDWEIVDEISEKGVSGYKVSTNARDAIVEIKRRAAQHQFDVLLVFMFDRLGRREDETPFVVQWFVQQGIEVWSTKEGEQRFDTHVDKLLNYIRFWQASGESEKTAIRVRTKHEQMVMDGQWRGGLVPYGYRLEFLGRTNKKNQPVRDLVIDEKEAAVIREIYQLITEKGYGTNRVANHLNEQGIKTKRGTTLWRGTSIRAIIDNPVYKGILRFGDERSEPFENLRIVSDEVYDRCLELVKGRACKGEYPPAEPVRTDSRSLLTGLLFCGHCGGRLCYNRNRKVKTLADGTEKVYDRDLYRCYRKISSRNSCSGPAGYEMQPLNEAVDRAVRDLLAQLGRIPADQMIRNACSRNNEILKAAYKQAVNGFEKTQKQVSALETEAVKALTGESQLDLSVVNGMLLRLRSQLDAESRLVEEAKARMAEEEKNRKGTEAKVEQILTWAERYDEASYESRHLIIAALVDRIEVNRNNEISIKFKVTAEQFLGKEQQSA